MRRTIQAALWLVLCALATPSSLAADARSDAQVRDLIIQESISSYPGNCPCPYNTDRAGRRCGGRSAYSRAGGYSPLCYPQDVSDDQVGAYRERHNVPKG